MTDLKPLTYRDFEIELTDLKDDGTFRVRVLGKTPDGREMASGEAETATFKAEEFAAPVGKLERRSLTQDDLQLLGERLAGLMLPGRVRELFSSSLNHVRQDGLGLRLRLRIDPLKLSALPWEYALVRKAAGAAEALDFLGLQHDISITRYETIGTPLEPVAPKDTYRVVIALANPIVSQGNLQPLEVEKDKNAILAAIRGLNKISGAIEPVVLEPASRNTLIEALKGSDIFHFAGHGVFESGGITPDGRIIHKGKILLEKDDSTEDRFDSDLLANALQTSDVRLVVLGACNTATRDESGAWSGVAPALVRENVPAVVAMQFRVADASAPRFIAQLYARVLQGYSIDQAVYEGRQFLFNQTGQQNGDWARDRDWGVPVLYLRAADGVLFPEPKVETEQATMQDGSPIVRARQRIRLLNGTAIAADVGEIISGMLEVEQDVDTVGEQGSLTGAKLGTIGGPRAPGRT